MDYTMSNYAYADTCIDELENTVRETTLHTQKAISAEKKHINAFKKQYSILIRETAEIKAATSKLDNDTRTYYEHFKTMQNSYESLKKSHDLLEEHERELSEKIQQTLQSSSVNENERTEILKSYQDKWELAYQHYEQHPLAIGHKEKKGKMIQIEELVKSYESQARQLEADIFKHKCERSRKNDLDAILVNVTRFVIEIVMLRAQSFQMEQEITVATKEKQHLKIVLQEKQRSVEQTANKEKSPMPQRMGFKSKSCFAPPSIGFQAFKLFIPNLSSSTQSRQVCVPAPAMPCQNSEKDVSKPTRTSFKPEKMDERKSSQKNRKIEEQASSQKTRKIEAVEIPASEPGEQVQLLTVHQVPVQASTESSRRSESNLSALLTQVKEISSNLKNNDTTQKLCNGKVTELPVHEVVTLPSRLNYQRERPMQQTPSIQHQLLAPTDFANIQHISLTSNQLFRQPAVTSNETVQKEQLSGQSTPTSNYLADKQHLLKQTLTFSGQQSNKENQQGTPENAPCGSEIQMPSNLESPQFAYPRRLMHSLEQKTFTTNRMEAAYSLTPTPPDIIKDNFLNSARKGIMDRKNLELANVTIQNLEDRQQQEHSSTFRASEEKPSSPVRSETARLSAVLAGCPTPRKANPENNFSSKSGHLPEKNTQDESFNRNNFDTFFSKSSTSNAMQVQNKGDHFQNPNVPFGDGGFNFGTSFGRGNMPVSNKSPENTMSFNFGSYNDTPNLTTSTSGCNAFELFGAGAQTPNIPNAFSFMSHTSPETPPKDMAFSFF